jgi:hypothetical protein
VETWTDEIRKRKTALITELAKALGPHPAFEGVLLGETAKRYHGMTRQNKIDHGLQYEIMVTEVAPMLRSMGKKLVIQLNYGPNLLAIGKAGCDGGATLSSPDFVKKDIPGFEVIRELASGGKCEVVVGSDTSLWAPGQTIEQTLELGRGLGPMAPFAFIKGSPPGGGGSGSERGGFAPKWSGGGQGQDDDPIGDLNGLGSLLSPSNGDQILDGDLSGSYLVDGGEGQGQIRWEEGQQGQRQNSQPGDRGQQRWGERQGGGANRAWRERRGWQNGQEVDMPVVDLGELTLD